MEFVKVFDLAETGYRTWQFASFGLIFMGIGAAFILAPIVMRKLNFSYIGFEGKGYKLFKWIFFGFALIWTATSFLSTFSEYRALRDILITGSYGLVEGKVENFDPMPYGGGKNESFTVSGVKFAFSDYGITNAFNNTKSHGGPISEDSYVRICYAPGKKNNHILRLEIQGYKGPIKDYSSGISLFPSYKEYGDHLYPPNLANKIHSKIPWYSFIFIYIGIFDFIASLLFNVGYLKMSITLKKSTINVPIPSHLQKDTKQKLRNVMLRWDTNDGVVWMRPRGLNFFSIPPSTIAKWYLNPQQNEIIKQEVRVSWGLLLTLIAMFFCARPDFTDIPSKNMPPFGPDLMFLGFFTIGVIINGWILFRRMKNLCKKTISSSFE